MASQGKAVRSTTTGDQSDIAASFKAPFTELESQSTLNGNPESQQALVDKPFATSLADAERVTSASAAASRMLTVFHNRRWDADFLTLRRLIADGLLGQVVHLESHFDRYRPEVAGVWKEARAAGSWQDLGPHLIDQAICLFGRPLAVTADIATMRQGSPGPDWFHVILHYEGLRAVLHSSKLCADSGLRFAVHGTAGSWIKHGLDPQEAAVMAGAVPRQSGWGEDPKRGRLTPSGDVSGSREIANENGDYGLFWEAMVAAIRGDGPNPVPPDQALEVMRVMDAGLRSASERRTIDLSLL